jgi:3-hydroxybutyryl-CoA dehydrogenase
MTMLGVVGSGVMGAGIAQLGALGGLRTRLYDSSPEALESALERIGRDLARGAERERWTVGEAATAQSLVEPADDLEGCDLIIEAVPEELAVKHAVLSALPRDAVLATNTSSLSVAEIAAGVLEPERVLGMHFFNPPPRLRLVEVVAGPATTPGALALGTSVADAMGCRVLRARDSVGFIVNRCARPYYAEAMQLLEEGVADVATIDRACRLGGGFRMGPFELMDLIGNDTSLAVARMFFARGFGEPRWRPSPRQAALVAAGRLGRKTGAGWHEHPHTPPEPSRDPAPETSVAATLRELAERGEPSGAAARSVTAHALVDVSNDSLATAGRLGDVGFVHLPGSPLIELTRLPHSSPALIEEVEIAAAGVGLAVSWCEDAPGLIVARIVCQLVNEACFALGDAVAARDDIDAGMRLGVNHPRGPFEWGERLGWDWVERVLDGLFADRHDPRYRVAPRLRREAALSRAAAP